MRETSSWRDLFFQRRTLIKHDNFECAGGWSASEASAWYHRRADCPVLFALDVGAQALHDYHQFFPSP